MHHIQERNSLKVALTLLTGAMLLLLVMLPRSALAQGKLAKFGTFASTQQIEVDHSAWNSFLQNYIKFTDDNRSIVDYKNVNDADKKALKDYITAMEAIDVTSLTQAQAYAYWVNFYNALTIDLILDRYPLKSIRNIRFGRPWGMKITKVNNTSLTLDNIEHDILRVHWRDPRTHYAVNCASIGCPNLQDVAFTVENTDELLTKGATDFVNHPRGIEVRDNGQVYASSIYTWFKVDFGGNEAGVLDHVRQYASDDLKAALEGKTSIAGYDYDWSLNEK